MKIRIDSVRENPANLFRKAGYVFQRREQDEMSFVRPLARSGYPRFHAYVYMEGTALLINLHLDQKKETYGGGTRHHGEYEESKAVEEEVARIKNLLG